MGTTFTIVIIALIILNIVLFISPLIIIGKLNQILQSLYDIRNDLYYINDENHEDENRQ